MPLDLVEYGIIEGMSSQMRRVTKIMTFLRLYFRENAIFVMKATESGRLYRRKRGTRVV